ncbi:hypothetical protein COUCH_14950 [Couchioplanes caeruleus]|uniref:hypothetical protein n=1 Tax=Couchioplanes caeruleus TaxID=56438 RepID=UPI0020BD46E6|nr:hypothetical protein [Couchioplanes caeruleus]UQU67484.1 hypothetical protein COUCH_14950 [Couchioplanes caeruleus]
MTAVEKPPSKSTGREITEKAVEAGLNLVPLAGGPLGVAFAYAVSFTYNRRMTQWLEDLAEAVDDLACEVDGIDLENLAANDNFVDAVASATQAATRTHQALKIAALRNAVLNSALRGAPGGDTQLIFLRWIEDYTAAHLQVLTLLNDPETWYAQRGIPVRKDIYSGSRRQLVEDGIPEFAGQHEFIDVVVRDLSNAGLLSISSLGGMISGNGMYQAVTSDLAAKFIAFITDPRKSSTPAST